MVAISRERIEMRVDNETKRMAERAWYERVFVTFCN